MSAETISTTYWHCEGCGSYGALSYPSRASVYTVVDLLEQAHTRAIGGKSCEFDLTRVRVSRGCPSCGCRDNYDDEHGAVWCGNENCRRPLIPAAALQPESEP